MAFLRLRYYPDGAAGPVRGFLQDLASRCPEAWVKVALDLEVLAAEGLRSHRIAVRGLGDGLWELKRPFAGIQYRIFFCVSDGAAWLLHAMKKKSAGTPLDDIRLARRRMRTL